MDKVKELSMNPPQATITFPDGTTKTVLTDMGGNARATLEWLIKAIQEHGTREGYREGDIDFRMSITDLATIFGPVELVTKLS